MNLQVFLIKLLITIGVIWLTQFLLNYFGIEKPAKNIVFVVVILAMVLWLLGIIFF